MSYHGWVSVLLNSFTALVIAFFVPRILSSEEPSRTVRMSWWVYVFGLALLGLSSWKLFSGESSLAHSIHSIWLAAAALAGTALKWTFTVLTSRGQSFHESSLVKSLLFSPIGLICGVRLFLGSGISVLAVFFFANGFFWQAVFDDGGRIFSKEGRQ